MTFSKGGHGYHEPQECAYPSCRKRMVHRDDDIVIWEGVNVSKKNFEDNLSPMAKLATIANPSEYYQKHGQYYVQLVMHAECAAEWGMHLIKDALEGKVAGHKLRRGQNAIHKQT